MLEMDVGMILPIERSVHTALLYKQKKVYICINTSLGVKPVIKNRHNSKIKRNKNDYICCLPCHIGVFGIPAYKEKGYPLQFAKG